MIVIERRERFRGALLGLAAGDAVGASTEEVAYGDRASFTGAGRIVTIARGAYAGKGASAVRGSGYVVESLEAAMWCFMTTDSFGCGPKTRDRVA